MLKIVGNGENVDQKIWGPKYPLVLLGGGAERNFARGKTQERGPQSTPVKMFCPVSRVIQGWGDLDLQICFSFCLFLILLKQN